MELFIGVARTSIDVDVEGIPRDIIGDLFGGPLTILSVQSGVGLRVTIAARLSWVTSLDHRYIFREATQLRANGVRGRTGLALSFGRP